MEKNVATAQSNRRRSQRRKPRSSVRLQCRKGSQGFGPNLAAGALDLSESGVRLIVTQALDDMAEVEVVIDGYGMNRPIKRVANVRWQVKMDNGQFCTGVEFQKRIDYRDWQNFASPN
jgi:hypothetical protein